MGQPYFTKNLRNEEVIVTVFHPSFWAIRGSIFSNIVLWCLPFFLLIPLVRLKVWGLIIGGLVLFMALWWSIKLIITWYYTSLIVTDRRTVYYKQEGFFERTVAEIPFRSLQDISYERKGMNAVLTNFGTVIIQSASSTQRLECPKLGHPEKVVDVIRETQAAWLQAKHGDPAYDAMYPTNPLSA
jgi:hypothetical protein